VIGSRNVLAVIPARGGSKGLPGKNILPVHGRPLLSWTTDAALAAAALDRVVVSSDSDAILAAARACGVEALRRPAELATDTATTLDVVLHALDACPGHDVVVVLQPTSPLRTAADIDAALDRFAASGAPSCVSVCEAEQSPYWMYRLGDGQALLPVVEGALQATRRQDLPAVYVLNGAVYVADAAWLRTTRAFVAAGTVAHVMPPERSLDIDTAHDFERFEKTVTETSHA
jgi:N-acylneuraminate cytidylyltransferase